MADATPLDPLDLHDRHWWFRGQRHAVLELGRRLVHRGGAVVQVGCGTGAIIGAFPNSVHRHGLDPSPAAIATARARYPGATFELGAPPHAGRDAIGAADLVILCDVLEHIYDDARFIGDLLAGMRSGAHLLLTVPTVRWPRSPGGSESDIRRYTRRSLARTWRGLPVSPRLVAPLNRRLHPVVRTLRTVGAWPPPEAGDGAVARALPWPPVNAALERLLTGEVRALIAALRTSRREVPGHGTSLLAVLECAVVPGWEDAAGSGGAVVAQG